MTDPDDRTRHLLALYVDEVKEVSGMIKPTSCLRTVLVLEYSPFGLFVPSSGDIVTYGRCPKDLRWLHNFALDAQRRLSKYFGCGSH